jgi:hypothetical protein
MMSSTMAIDENENTWQGKFGASISGFANRNSHIQIFQCNPRTTIRLYNTSTKQLKN